MRQANAQRSRTPSQFRYWPIDIFLTDQPKFVSIDFSLTYRDMYPRVLGLHDRTELSNAWAVVAPPV